MCRCWGLSRKKKIGETSQLAMDTMSCSVNELDLGRASRASNADEVEQVDKVDNDRLLWDTGVAVEVWSETNSDWFVGKIIEVVNISSGRVLKVVYDGKTKSIPVFSRTLRPLTINTNASHGMKSFAKALQEANHLIDEHRPEIKTIVLDAFISYSQNDAKDAVGVLYLLLKIKGFNAWFDQQQDDISITGMSKGIAKSCCFIIFLTRSYFRKTFTVFELETALALNKEIIVVWEGDDQCGGHSDFQTYMNACPEKYKTQLFEKEALKFERRKQLQEAQVNVIVARIAEAYDNKVTVNR